MEIKAENRIEELLKALENEKNDEIQNYVDSTNIGSIQNRVESGRTLYPLNYLGIKFSKFGDSLLEFEINDSQVLTMFSVGSLVEVFNAEGESAKGTIAYTAYNKLSVRINLVEIEDWVRKGKIGMNVLPDSKTYDLYIDNLKSIIDTKTPSQINFIYNEQRIFNEQATESVLNDLNASQNIAVSQVLNTENIVSIIHGPPGTGKTTTITSAINELVKKGKKVIVCAPTNTAVDNICQKLLSKNIKLCRIGNPVKVDSKLQDITLDGQAVADSSFKLVEQLKKQSNIIRKQAFKFKRNFDSEAYAERKRLKYELKSIRKDIKTIQKDIYKNILETSDVICGTFIGLLSENLSKIEFDYVFVDEAAQAVEPAIWSICKMANKLVLVGDNFQLPPFVQSSNAIKLGLDKSILEVASSFNFPTQLLDVQYRMNEKIMSFSNDYFYNSKLKSAQSVKNRVLENENFKAIEFIDTAGCNYEEEKESNSFGLFNVGEIDLLIKRFSELNMGGNTYGIISPYRLQVKLMQEKFKSQMSFINTIDSFQGQERDVIVISLVRSNVDGDIGFLKDYRRMNVAMTRAKKKLIIIGDSATIGNDKFYSGLLDFIEANGSYRSAWEYFE